jgi:hypothetical protein
MCDSLDAAHHRKSPIGVLSLRLGWMRSPSTIKDSAAFFRTSRKMNSADDVTYSFFWT